MSTTSELPATRTSVATVVFADLTGSTGVFEQLGNEVATRVVTGLTRWIGQVCVRHGGRVVKTLGDGVMVVFAEVSGAVDAVVHLQREHALRRVPAAGQALQLQVGLDRGELVEVGGDCFGDAVNVAARLSGLSGAREIWATDTVIAQLARPPAGARFHCLGEVPIRGKTQQRQVYRIEWQEAVAPRA